MHAKILLKMYVAWFNKNVKKIIKLLKDIKWLDKSAVCYKVCSITNCIT